MKEETGDGGQKKKSKQIKFDLPSDQPVSEGDVNGGSASTEQVADDGVTSSVEATVSLPSAEQVETSKEQRKTGRITYDRV